MKEGWLPDRDQAGPFGWDTACIAAKQHGFDVWCAGMAKKLERYQARESYSVMIHLSGSMAYGKTSSEAVAYVEEEVLARRLLDTCYALEERVTPEGAGELLPMVPGLGEAEFTARLAALDAARVVFKQHLVTGFRALRDQPGVRALIAFWARIVYCHVHAFQAPFRLDAAQAALDAAGLSDHFTPLLREAEREAAVE